MRVEVYPTTYQHVVNLAPRMRLRDIEEVYASSGFTPEEALLMSITYSDPDLSWSAIRTDTQQVVSMFGVAPFVKGNTDVGAVWLLSSDEIEQLHREAWVLSKRAVDTMHERYSVLTNYIDVRNLKSMNWIEKLGFYPVDFDNEYGYEKRPFIRYESIRYV